MSSALDSFTGIFAKEQECFLTREAQDTSYNGIEHEDSILAICQKFLAKRQKIVTVWGR